MTSTPEPAPYALLDSGQGRKLERLGDYLVDRQAGVAVWPQALPPAAWAAADAVHHRGSGGEGRWEWRSRLPESWLLRHGGLVLKVKLTGFGHLGFFPEQADQWLWFRQAATLLCSRLGRPPQILNLFGYTGGTSLSLGLAGAEVTHVDAARGIVDWGREIAALNRLPDGRVRWIVDDCLAFLRREQRRGRRYDGIILDPPSFGRGPKKEVWKLEEHIGELLSAIAAVLAPEPALLHFSSHSSGFTPIVLRNLLADTLPTSGLACDLGEMVIPETEGGRRPLPSGAFCRFLLP